jgi:hypothetical protein
MAKCTRPNGDNSFEQNCNSSTSMLLSKKLIVKQHHMVSIDYSFDIMHDAGRQTATPISNFANVAHCTL